MLIIGGRREHGSEQRLVAREVELQRNDALRSLGFPCRRTCGLIGKGRCLGLDLLEGGTEESKCIETRKGRGEIATIAETNVYERFRRVIANEILDFNLLRFNAHGWRIRDSDRNETFRG